MTIQQQFKNLNGSEVTRKQLERIIANAKRANETEIVYRLSKILLDNKGVDAFDISLRNYPTALAGSRHKGAYKEALTECGRLRKGWKFSKGGVFKVATLDKKTKQFSMGLNGKKPCGCVTKTTCGCKKKNLNANNSLNAPHHLGIFKHALDECGRLRPGWKYKNGAVVQISSGKNFVKPARLVRKKKSIVKKPTKKADAVVKPTKKNTKTPSKEELFSKEDIPYQLAYDAHRGTSFDPEKRAVSHQNEYYNTLKDTHEINYKKAIELSKEDDFEAKFIRFKNGYLNRYLAYLRSKNGMMSTMITGGSNFPVARMRKKSDAIDKKLNELVEFVDKYDNFFKAKAPSKIKTGSADALEKLNKKLIDLEEQHSLMKKGNAVINKVLRKKGLSRDAQIKEITIGFEDFFKQKVIEAWVKLNKDGSSIKSNSFYLTNLTANIREVKKQIVLEKGLKESSDEKGNTEIEFENGTIIINRDINKFQILFDGKPDADVRAFLKKSGHAFKWSPTNGVWQRQLNTYYRGNIDDLYAFLGVEVNNPPTKKAKTVEKPAVKKGGKEINITVTTKIGTNTATFKTDKEANDFLEKLNKDKLQTLFNLQGGVGKFTPSKYLTNHTSNYTTWQANFGRNNEVRKKPLYDKMARLSEDSKITVSIKTNETEKLTANDITEFIDKPAVKKVVAVLKPTKKEDVTKYAYQKITTKEVANLSDEELYLLYLAIAKQQHEKGIDADLIRYNRSLIIKSLKYPLKHYSYLNKTYSFTFDKLIKEKTLFDYAILARDAHMYPDEVIAKGYAYNKLAWFIYYHRKSFPFYQRTELIEQVAKPELGKLFEKEIKKRKLTVNVDINIPLNNQPKNKADAIVKPAVKEAKIDTPFKISGSLPIQLEQVETGMKSAKSSLSSWESHLKGIYPYWEEDRYTDDFCLKNIDYFKRLVKAFENQKKMIIKRDAKKKAKTVVKPAVNTENLSKPKTSLGGNSLASKLANRQNKVSEIYKIKDKNISEFLGEIEVKQKESVVITLTGGQGSMKTRCAFRFMNAFAQKYKVGHASIEEHPESTLYYNKVDEYINDNALNNIHNPEINSISDLDTLVKENDIIVIDSFAKMQEIQKGFEVDKDLRKKYDGKLFIVIFQQTTDGKMRGGSKSQFDADIILFTEKFDDYQENYIYADKNRYQNKNLSDLKYNIFEGVLKIE
ncbi:hypothetical protein F7649_10550 [Tenacibaculum piscium]|uniref:hypothetical protein n=1 Tax=Tenacibaculum piscium TaxID=1458515 RepID=UPI00187B51A0|nr:hypothetical protein [Tenacibaculum piscium]MBE7671551.1 hypothetical protein [Tenacibaculum piscium]